MRSAGVMSASVRRAPAVRSTTGTCSLQSNWNTKLAGTRIRHLHYCALARLGDLTCTTCLKQVQFGQCSDSSGLGWAGMVPAGAVSLDGTTAKYDTCLTRINWVSQPPHASLGHLINKEFSTIDAQACALSASPQASHPIMSRLADLPDPV